MTKEQKIYCRIGQAVVEGLGCIAVGLVFATMIVLRIIL